MILSSIRQELRYGGPVKHIPLKNRQTMSLTLDWQNEITAPRQNSCFGSILDLLDRISRDRGKIRYAAHVQNCADTIVKEI